MREIVKGKRPSFLRRMLRRMYMDIRYAGMHVVSPSWYLKRRFKECTGYSLNLKAPKTFNEKLQWLKLYDHNPLHTTMVDKYTAKEYVGKIIGRKYIIPTLGVWNRFEDIDFDALPAQFVLKCTHDSGGVFVVKDKTKFDKEAARQKITEALRYNFYYSGGYEWPYKNVKPRIIAEKYMEDFTSQNSEDGIVDYKLMCFDGKVRCSFTCTGRGSQEGLRVTFFDNDWQKLPFYRHYLASDHPVKKPQTFAEMKQLAEKLAQGIPFVRIDFYEINGQVYFGEITFFPGCGFEEFHPEAWDRTLGDWIPLKGV